jgi:transcription elongation factor S-II
MESAMLDEKTGAARRLQLLKALKGAEPTVEVLQETKIGLTVNALRKDGSEDVRTLASALRQKWKALYQAQKSNDEQK